MPTAIPAHLLSSFSRDIPAPCYLICIYFSSGIMRFCSRGITPVTLNGEVFKGGFKLTNLHDVMGGGIAGSFTLSNDFGEYRDVFRAAEGARVDVWLGDGSGPFNSGDVAHLMSGMINTVGGVHTTEISCEISTAGRLGERIPNLIVSDVCDWIDPAGRLLNWGCEQTDIDDDVSDHVVPLLFGMWQTQPIITTRVVKDGHLYLRCLWGVGEIAAIDAITINDNALPDSVEVVHYLGGAGQGVDPWLAEVIAGYADTLVSDEGVACAYSVLKIPVGAVNGIPRIRATGRGLLIADPRTGGVTYSASPALILAALGSNAAWGLGRDVTGVAECATADEALLGANPRRRVGLALNKESKPAAVLEDLAVLAGVYLRSTATGFVMVSNRVVAEADYKPAIDRLEKESFKPTLVRFSELPSEVRVTYTDTTETPWAKAVVIVKNPSAITRKPVSLSRPEIQDGAQAMRYAEEYLWALLYAGEVYQFTAFSHVLHHQRGDVARLKAPGWGDELVRILAVIATGDGKYSVTCQQYDERALSDSVVSVSPNLPPPLPSVRGINAPESLTLSAGEAQQERPSDGGIVYKIKVAVTRPALVDEDQYYFKRFVCEYKTPDDDDWRSVSIDSTSGIGEISSVKDGVEYTVRALAENCAGSQSGWITQKAVPEKKDTAPPKPTSISGARRTDGSRTVTISQPSLPDDYAGTDVWYYAGGWVALKTRVDTREARTFTANEIPAGSHKLRARNYDRSGNASADTGSASINFGLDQSGVVQERIDSEAALQTEINQQQIEINTAQQTAVSGVAAAAEAASAAASAANDAYQASVDASEANAEAISALNAATSPSGDYFSDLHGPMVDATNAARDRAEQAITVKIPNSRILGGLDGAKIADYTVTGGKIVNYSITETKIADNSISTGKLKANSITANELAANSVTAVQITAGAISAFDISASQITSGLLSADRIFGGTSGRFTVATNGAMAAHSVTSYNQLTAYGHAVLNQTVRVTGFNQIIRGSDGVKLADYIRQEANTIVANAINGAIQSRIDTAIGAHVSNTALRNSHADSGGGY